MSLSSHFMGFRILLACSVFSLLPRMVAAGSDLESTSMVYRVFHYIPNKYAAGVAGGLYLLSSFALFARLYRARTWWGLCLPLAAHLMAFGFIARIFLANNPNSIPLFMLQQFLIILPPAAYLAFNYILYGRFIVYCVDRRHSLINPEWVARVFVTSDITTFLIQAGGGGLESMKNPATQLVGSRLFLAGLLLQTLSFAFFILLVIRAHRSILREGIKPSKEIWGPLLNLLYLSSFFFLVRCIYRSIELGEGFAGYLNTHEIYFYTLDSLPLIIGISIYIIFWPEKYLESPLPKVSGIPLQP